MSFTDAEEERNGLVFDILSYLGSVPRRTTDYLFGGPDVTVDFLSSALVEGLSRQTPGATNYAQQEAREEIIGAINEPITSKDAADKVVKNIRRKTRQTYILFRQLNEW